MVSVNSQGDGAVGTLLSLFGCVRFGRSYGAGQSSHLFKIEQNPVLECLIPVQLNRHLILDPRHSYSKVVRRRSE